MPEVVQIKIRVSRDLSERLEVLAAREKFNPSTNKYIVALLADHVAKAYKKGGRDAGAKQKGR